MRRRPLRYQPTTGLCDNDVDEIVRRVQEVLECQSQSLKGCHLSVRQQVEVTLVLLHHSISQALAADMYGVSQPTVSRVFRRMVPLTIQVLAMSGTSLAQAVASGTMLLIGGTPIPTGNRPASGRQVEKANLSGKHHAQCLNVQVAATTDGTLAAVSDPVAGSRHDSVAPELRGWTQALNDGPAHWVAGTANTSYGALTPIKMTPHRRHLPREKRLNRAIASILAPVEHAIAALKKWKILSTGYRHRLTELPHIITLVTKLELHRLGW